MLGGRTRFMTAVEHRSKPIPSAKKLKAGQMCLVGEKNSIYAYQVVEVLRTDKKSAIVREVYCSVSPTDIRTLSPCPGAYCDESAETLFAQDSRALVSGTQCLYPMKEASIRF